MTQPSQENTTAPVERHFRQFVYSHFHFTPFLNLIPTTLRYGHTVMPTRQSRVFGYHCISVIYYAKMQINVQGENEKKWVIVLKKKVNRL